MRADLKLLEDEVRAIKKDGLLWGSSEPSQSEMHSLPCVMCRAWGQHCLLHLFILTLILHVWPYIQQVASHPCVRLLILNECCLHSAGKLVPVGYGIKKMQITAVIEDAKVESMDAIIEEELVRDGESDNIQSIDVVSFNKL